MCLLLIVGELQLLCWISDNVYGFRAMSSFKGQDVEKQGIKLPKKWIDSNDKVSSVITFTIRFCCSTCVNVEEATLELLSYKLLVVYSSSATINQLVTHQHLILSFVYHILMVSATVYFFF